MHWIFALSNHGKGDCDSHGAVVKRSIRLFVLNGTIYFVAVFNINTDTHHVDDELEAVVYINQHIKNSKAFIMVVKHGETEQDCSALRGSSTYYEL